MTTFHADEFVRVVAEDARYGGMTGTVQHTRPDGKVAVKLTAWGRVVAFPPSRLVSEDAACRQRSGTDEQRTEIAA